MTAVAAVPSSDPVWGAPRIVRRGERALTVWEVPRSRPDGPDDRPVALVVSGLGGAWFDWEAVALSVRDRVRVLVVDRPGYGLPLDGPTVTPDLTEIADDLATVLDDVLAPGPGPAGSTADTPSSGPAGTAPPRVVLVGHSLGAWYVEAFARLRPERVAGLVLVDGSLLPRATTPLLRAQRLAGPLVDAVPGGWCYARLGPALRRLLEGVHPTGAWGARHRELCRLVYGRPQPWRASLAELAVEADLAAALREMRTRADLPAVPVRAVVARLPWIPAAVSSWVRDQRRQARTWAEGPGPAPTVQVVRGRHMIMLQWPAVLAGALLELAADAAPTPAP